MEMLDCKKLLQEVTLAGTMTIFDCKKLNLAGTMEIFACKKCHWLEPWKCLTARSYYKKLHWLGP